jgi:trehalose 2-sulfotransferase
MLARLDTGYEGKFDFPRRADPPSLTYIVATLPRTGGTWFTHLLWETGCMGAPLEYLNFDPSGPYYFAARSPSVQQTLWHSVLARRTSPNGAFGLKCFPNQLESLGQENSQLLSQVMSMFVTDVPRPKVVYLERTDRSAHAISYARASLSGVWRSEQESEQETAVAYSEKAIRRAQEALDLQSAAWEQMFSDLRIRPLRLSYETIVSDPGTALLRVGQFLGVELNPKASIVVPSVHKQADDHAKAWAERFGNGDRSDPHV